MSENQIYLTREKLEELEHELDYLKNIKRREVAQRIQEAKELGDLSENAEYAEAKDDQAWTEGRILNIGDVLLKGVIVDDLEKNLSATVNIGSKVKTEQAGNERSFEIVGSQEADPLQGKISNESPLGKAFIGKKAGDIVEVEAPKGIIKYKIIAIS